MKRQRREHKLLFAGGAGGGGIFGHGVITSADCDEYSVTIDADADTTWISECVALPDQYNGNITIYDPCPDDNGIMAEVRATALELENKIVIFMRVFNSYTCAAEYHMIHICLNTWCDESGQ